MTITGICACGPRDIDAQDTFGVYTCDVCGDRIVWEMVITRLRKDPNQDDA